MLIQVNSDNHTEANAAFIRHVEAVLEGALERFGDKITRVEVHFTDENSSAKVRDKDKRCVLEARLAGLQPITVSDQGSTLDHALSVAVDKLEKMVDKTLARLDSLKGRTSYSGD